jgi:hypothetical protein
MEEGSELIRELHPMAEREDQPKRSEGAGGIRLKRSKAPDEFRNREGAAGAIQSLEDCALERRERVQKGQEALRLSKGSLDRLQQASPGDPPTPGNGLERLRNLKELII